MSQLKVRADEVQVGDKVLGKDGFVVSSVETTKTGDHCFVSLWAKTPKGKLVTDFLPGDDVYVERK